jgi:hypothetical protein
MSTAARFVTPLVVAVAAFGFVACGDTAPDPAAALFSDSTVTLDVAASSGDAMATALETMRVNDSTAVGSSADFAGSTASLPTNTLTTSRTRTCFDANGAVVANCTPNSSVRKIVTLATLDGTRAGSRTTEGGSTSTWTGAVHRVSNDTTLRIFNTAQTPVETSRTHNSVVVGHDTTVFTDATLTRTASEAARDSVKGITFNLPRSSNPWPVSGSIVRVDSVHVAVAKGTMSVAKDVVRTVSITFPADAQGNVVLKINLKTCNLNLVTHVVSGCQ